MNKKEIKLSIFGVIAGSLIGSLSGCTTARNHFDAAENPAAYGTFDAAETPAAYGTFDAAETPAAYGTFAAAETPAAVTRLLTVNENDYPRVDGSTAAIPLGEAVAAVLTGTPRAECADYARFTGTDSAYRRLLNDEADLLLVYEATAATKAELNLVNDNNAPLLRAPIGSDALVFLVNADNPVDRLTTAQLRQIYAGEITNWQEVGGEDAPITAFQRNQNAGSQALIEALVMKGTPMVNPREDFIANTMEGLLTAVADFDTGRYAIGYNVYYYVTAMKNDPHVKILTVDGIVPEKETIKAGVYPLVSDFYAVIRRDEPPYSPAGRIFNWLQETEGQTLIDLEGYAAKDD